MIWAVQTPSKLKMFLWKCLHRRLPTRDRLHKFFDSIDPRCVLCHGHLETTNHLFSSCPATSGLWCFLSDKLQLPTPTEPIATWFWNQTKEDLGFVSWFWWYISKSRNDTIFKFNPFHPPSVLGKIFKAIHEQNIARTFINHTNANCLYPARWTIPSGDTHKLNFDGSFHPTHGTAGIGGILRDDCGTLVRGFTSGRPLRPLLWRQKCKLYFRALNCAVG